MNNFFGKLSFTFEQLVLLLFSSLTGTYFIMALLMMRFGGAPAYQAALSLTIMGHVVAAPPLLFVYFPWSIWTWHKKKKRSIFRFIFFGAFTATMYGVLWLVVSQRIALKITSIETIGPLIVFAACGSMTASFHWMVLRAAVAINRKG